MNGVADNLSKLGDVAAMAASTVGEGAAYVVVGVADGVSSAASVVEENAAMVAGGIVDGASSLSSSTAATLGMVASAVPSPATPVSCFQLSADFSPAPDEVAPLPFEEGSYPGQPNIQVQNALIENILNCALS